MGQLMALTMRPASLSSGIDKDRADYTVFCGEWNIGRIYEVRGGPEHLRWFGRCTSRASRRAFAQITAWPRLRRQRPSSRRAGGNGWRGRSSAKMSRVTRPPTEVSCGRGNVIDKSPIDGLKPVKITNIKRAKLRAREVAINNDFGLEKEADVMGRAASRDLRLEKEEAPVTHIKTSRTRYDAPRRALRDNLREPS